MPKYRLQIENCPCEVQVSIQASSGSSPVPATPSPGKAQSKVQARGPIGLQNMAYRSPTEIPFFLSNVVGGHCQKFYEVSGPPE